MPNILKNQGFLFITLSLLMVVTRGSHFSGFNALPEASWMIFMVAGTLLPVWSFAWFMSLAVGIDAYAFTFGGVPGTCFSVAYAMLIPAYFSMWMAGAGVKRGFEYGKTDDHSYNIIENPVHIRDMNATILHQLGIDHNKLTFKYQGLDQRLTGVEEAHVVKDILS